MPAETTPSPFKDMQLTPDQLRELVEHQHRRIQKLETQVERLQEEIDRLLRRACALHREYHDNSSPYFRAVQFPLKRHRLLKRLEEHLRPRKLPDRAAQTLLNRLGKLHQKGHLVRFLFELDLETTNNRAERALRGPVIARKLSYGSRTAAGAYAFSAFSSVIRTLRLRDCPDLAGALLEVFQTGMLPQ